MFTAEERSRLRSSLLESAAGDSRISAAAITGSAAADREDRWSDIDLAFGLRQEASLPDVLGDWTMRMYAEHHALHHCDVKSGSWVYRVFLLSNTLQVDLAFVSLTEFRALAPTFRVVFGEAKEPAHLPLPTVDGLAGMGWLYALHARSSIARGNLWQAEYMVSGVRDCALAMACARHGLPAVHAKGIDQLPDECKQPLEAALVRRLEPSELKRAFRVAALALLAEVRGSDEALAARLQPVVMLLIQDSP